MLADDVWPIASADTRDACAFLIQHLPVDGRYEVVIRKIRQAPPTDAGGEPYRTRGDDDGRA